MAQRTALCTASTSRTIRQMDGRCGAEVRATTVDNLLIREWRNFQIGIIIIGEEGRMQVLLLSMPDSFEHMPTVGIRMPNGALSSIAGNVDSHHKVAVADLILVQDRVRQIVSDLVADLRPEVVGLSAMTFQRKTAKKLIRLIRDLAPDTKIVAGGYDPSLAADAYTAEDGADFVIRGEGESAFRELLRALEDSNDFPAIRLTATSGRQ